MCGCLVFQCDYFFFFFFFLQIHGKKSSCKSPLPFFFFIFFLFFSFLCFPFSSILILKVGDHVFLEADYCSYIGVIDFISYVLVCIKREKRNDNYFPSSNLNFFFLV